MPKDKGCIVMPRTSRLIIPDEKAVYHVMSRTALDGFPLQDVEKDFMLDLIKRLSALYFAEILGFCIMGNHFHLLVKMIPDHDFSDEEIRKRFEAFFGESRELRPSRATSTSGEYSAREMPLSSRTGT